MAEPTNKTILLMDIEGSGGRLDNEQAVIRRMLYAVLRETLSAASVEPTEYRSEDRGDGVFVLIEPSVPKPALVRALLTTTPMRLVSNNRLAAAGTQVRLRLVVHTGEVALDEFGAVGADLVHAFRLLDAPELRDALRATPEPSVLCVSDAVYQGVVRHAHHGIRPEYFHPLAVGSKEGAVLTGWYHATVVRDDGRSGEPASAPAAAPSPAAAAPSAPERGDATEAGPGPVLHTRTGNFFFGSARIQGDAVAGDKYAGDGPAGRSGHRSSEGAER
ncbi:hypothetical protein AR457_16195 [Streptomyces agglomeratus]|uniref:Guanylate cyclase domain-containing protein n=1 Tax=Streptomyces agglomeratus TaxID=285458 RepID=A0A1E5P8A2_9ACTN|nr:hypothetical protein [Streptomyces agglomeratus]OEJ25781.1 hypothetical protein AS594_16045 [Streptomyces agglomeratus]OEJ40180.1 hypothetical protein BGK70_20460 [Streptomyces agglomeratus]OEJ45441.1 hypothetical protein AR457_16195 [Streptomyces agglomeratus]OEJ52727.1 hypothetical protein BGK72_20075 [Streptomyces agglomeratus]